MRAEQCENAAPRSHRSTRSSRSTLQPCPSFSFLQFFNPFGEEAPGGPELLELSAPAAVEGVDLARRPLLGEASLAKLRGDLVAVRRAPLIHGK